MLPCFHASIEDKEFFGRFNAGDRFGRGDVLVVDLRQVQSIVGAKLVNEPIIVKVWEHRPPSQHNLI